MEGNCGKMEGGVNMFLRISRLYPKQENVSDINIYYSNYLSLNMSVIWINLHWDTVSVPLVKPIDVNKEFSQEIFNQSRYRLYAW